MVLLSLNIATPILAIIFGILILAFPKLLRWLVGLYFVIFGIINLFA